MTEKTIQTKQCKNCSTNFDITDKDIEFYDKVSPVFDGKKYLIPSPTLCPDCRQQRRLAWRNVRKLYHRKCDLFDKNIISIYSPESSYKIYNQIERWSDKWDPMGFGRDIDFNIPFFDQFENLMKTMPRPSLIALQNENSPYANYIGYSKNIYLSDDVLNSENVYHSTNIKSLKNCCDVFDVTESEIAYECISSKILYNCAFVFDSENCTNSFFLSKCKSVDNSIFCSNIQNKSYYLFNKQSSKEEIESFKKTFGNYKQLLKAIDTFSNFLQKMPKLSIKLINTQNCTGNNLINSKNSFSCFDSYEMENCKYCIVGNNNTNCYDTTIFNPNVENILECISGGGGLNNSGFCELCWESSKLYYCEFCIDNSSNLFGCIGLRNKKYCILNKQYTKEQYEQLVPKIIEHMQSTGEWGEFFPASISPFGYNETVAQEYFPINRSQALNKGYKWMDKEYPINVPDGIKTINAQDLPDNISAVTDDILKKAVICEITGKPFRIIKPELEFYKKHNIPLPRKHPDQRHLERMKLRNPRKLFDRKCYKCSIDMKTTYAPEREEIVYCEKCYEKEIY